MLLRERNGLFGHFATALPFSALDQNHGCEAARVRQAEGIFETLREFDAFEGSRQAPVGIASRPGDDSRITVTNDSRILPIAAREEAVSLPVIELALML